MAAPRDHALGNKQSNHLTQPNRVRFDSSPPLRQKGSTAQCTGQNAAATVITMASTVPLNVGRRRVFHSVFSPASIEARPPFADPTSQASFQSAASSSTVRTDPQSQSFTSLHEQAPSDPETWNRAWAAATAYLSIPDRGFEDSEIVKRRERENTIPPPSRDTVEAFSYLLAAAKHTNAAQGGTASRDLCDWYSEEMRRHFLTNLQRRLREILEAIDKRNALKAVVCYLECTHRSYMGPIRRYIIPLVPTQGHRIISRLDRGFHTVVAYSLQWRTISPLLANYFAEHAVVILGINTLIENSRPQESNDDKMEVDKVYSVSYKDWKATPRDDRVRLMTEGEDIKVTKARERLLKLLGMSQLVGLGGDKAQKVFAGVMNVMMTEFIRAAYTSQWEAPSWTASHLRCWVENVFGRLVVQVLDIIHKPAEEVPGNLDVSFGNLEKWQAIAISRLGALRTSELFEVIAQWPQSKGAMQDLKHFIVHAPARQYLSNSFITTLYHKLLHPGASTVQILQLYISIIRAFHMLDPKGVLLQWIARPIRQYLRYRDDTVEVIVRGLLAKPGGTHDPKGLPSGDDTLHELSTELSNAHKLSQQNNTHDLDWNDMNWTPDPMDASADYQKPKGADVIDSLISLFDSKETFVKELQTHLADRLLQDVDTFNQEKTVLDLLKIRFGDSSLQACEVMLRDISASRTANDTIRGRQLHEGPASPDSDNPSGQDVELNVKILSRFFWPEFKDNVNFTGLPQVTQACQKRFSQGFEDLKSSRKLTWLTGLGQVTVELELGDRTVEFKCTTWQATVISQWDYDPETSPALTLDVKSLAESLGMPENLVRSACLFWTSHGVLVERHKDHYQAVEYLSSEDAFPEDVSGDRGTVEAIDTVDAAAAAEAAEAAAAAAAKETAEAAAMEKMNLYWQFIVGMLTNQGAMNLQKIVMMLKIVVPGGFPFNNEELREFLAGMVSKGKLEIVSGGNYKLVQ
ncbi:hypothetical protein N7532_003215 [Penicillium argentinense]|uniref:Anaphase-promoting complex subunit 2 n=1 Tax=Penicillium argentinense TaxID=1131581 RepID=A0A9W9FM01_9EURO|nr:uncharacterized protein N7532_003215 [Penicillium argentinense]KAJ5102686.1 hypothetical protein N7532_003215 [Penicillium argentinense]